MSPRAVFRRRTAALAATGALLLAACGGAPAPEAAAQLRVAGVDYRRDGGTVFTVRRDQLDSVGGCRVELVHYEPVSLRAGAPLAVLGHGFLRSVDTLDGLARHLASWGIRAVSLDFCNSSIFAGRHDLNAVDMQRAAARVGAHAVAFVGMSAGGLSALLAAASSERATLVLGLDPVDDGSLVAALGALADTPVYAIVGDASRCNREAGIAASLRELRGSRVYRMPATSHCDFEYPSNFVCTLACGAPLRSRGELSPLLRGLAVAALIEPARKAWWHADGVNARRFLRAGLLVNAGS